MIETLTCAQCGKTFERRPTNVHKGVDQCCSRACSAAYGGVVHRRRIRRAISVKMHGRGWLPTCEVAELVGRRNHCQVRVHLNEMVNEGLMERASDGGRGKGQRAMWRVVPRIGRICAEPGCGTVLSRYNPDDYCALHAAQHMDHVEYMELCEVA